MLGTVLFAISIAMDIFENKDSSVLNLLGLRTMSEGVINLAFLLKMDDDDLWEQFRDYGIGQAKLNVLKLHEKTEHPYYIPFDDIERIANEDRWEEFSIVDVGDPPMLGKLVPQFEI